MKPKYHALPLALPAAITTAITDGGISIPPPYRLRLNLECREFSRPLSFSLPPFSLPFAERACCLPVKRQRIHPLLNQYCANLSATPATPVPTFPSQLVALPSPSSSPGVLPSTEPDMPPKESIVYSPHFRPPPPRSLFSSVIDLCANIEPRRRGRERKWERPDETA